MATPNSPAVDIKDILETQNVGTFAASSGWALAVSREPNNPDTVVTIYDTGGFDPNAKWLLDNPTILVRVRGLANGYLAAYAKAQEIKDILLGFEPAVQGGTKYSGIWQVSDIAPLPYDDNNRPILITNWRIVREPTSTGVNRDSL